MMLLQADVLELKANPDRPARGTVVESELDRGRGPVATVLIQEGTLRQGDPFVCGVAYGRVRAMLDHLGQRVDRGAARPRRWKSSGSPACPSPALRSRSWPRRPRRARSPSSASPSSARASCKRPARVSLQDLSERMKAGEVKELKVIIKGDVQGSVEALADSLARLSTAEVKIEMICTARPARSRRPT